jgi:hypothetical protein
MRSWRIGQNKACRTYYLYYDTTAQEKAIQVMASKLRAAEALEGKFSDGGLVDEAVDEDVAMAIAKQLSEKIKSNLPKRHRPMESMVEGDRHKEILRKRFTDLRGRIAGSIK